MPEHERKKIWSEFREWSAVAIALVALSVASLPFIDRFFPTNDARVRIEYDGIVAENNMGPPMLNLGVLTFNLGNRPFALDTVMAYVEPMPFDQASAPDSQPCDIDATKDALVINGPNTSSGSSSGWEGGIVPPNGELQDRVSVQLFPPDGDQVKLEGKLCVLVLLDNYEGHSALVQIADMAIQVPPSPPWDHSTVHLAPIAEARRMRKLTFSQR